MLKYMSMFSGIGGFELGIEKSNIPMECIGFSEVDEYAKAIYTRHFPKHKDFGDATKIKTEELGDFNFLVGGFPCQAFSICGKRGGFNDSRGTLFFELARILRDKKPEYFLFENVKGLLSHDNGRTISTMFRILSDLGYDVKWEVYNSKGFTAQNRERIYIAGYSREKCSRKIHVTSRTNQEDRRKIKKLANCNPKGTGFMGNVYDSTGLSPTLTRTLTRIRDETGRYRQLTPVECERLQGFPDNWTEGINKTERLKCIGNAVTVPLVTDIINEMFGDY